MSKWKLNIQCQQCASNSPNIGCRFPRLPRSPLTPETTLKCSSTDERKALICSSPGSAEGMTSFFGSIAPAPFGSSPRTKLCTMEVMLRFTIALCSSIMKKDQFRMSSSIPIMRGTRTGNAPVSAFTIRVSARYLASDFRICLEALSRLVKASLHRRCHKQIAHSGISLEINTKYNKYDIVKINFDKDLGGILGTTYECLTVKWGSREAHAGDRSQLPGWYLRSKLDPHLAGKRTQLTGI